VTKMETNVTFLGDRRLLKGCIFREKCPSF